MKQTDSQIFPKPLASANDRLLEDLPLAVFSCAADGRLADLNHAWQKLLGRDRPSCLSQRLEAFVAAADRAVLRMAIQSLQSRLEPYAAVEIQLLHASGQTVDAEVRMVARASGEIVGTVYDLTGLKQAERLRVESREKTHRTERLESLGLLASGIAHDFNNLLMGMLGNADLALAKLSPFSPGCEHIRGIVTHARRAADLCRQLLAYSGKSNFKIESIDLAHVLRENQHMLENSLPQKAQLEYHLEPQLPLIEADASQIRELIIHLLDNAAEAIDEPGGIITLTSGKMECSRAYFDKTLLGQDLEEGTYVFLEVTDNGCGLDEQAKARIFDPFFSARFTGRGLGLAAVLGIVRGHGGTLRVESEPDGGTSIRAHFPCSSQSAIQVSKKMLQEQTTDGGAGTILVVDDEEIVRSVARGMLELLGYNVLTAADGLEAIEIYKRQQNEIVLIVLDLAMPFMSGEETFERIRNLRADAKVVLSSGYDEQEATQRFTDKGLAGFIQKPYEVAAFSRIIHDALESD